MLRSSAHRGSCAAVVLTLLGLALPGCELSKTCTEAGCTSGAHMRIDSSAAATTFTGQTVTVCRNAECYASVIPEPSTMGTGTPFSFPATTAVHGALWSYPDQTSQLDLTWDLPWGSPAPQSADRYVVTVTSSTGTATTWFDKTTTRYEKVSPNGDDCGPICWKAKFAP